MSNSASIAGILVGDKYPVRIMGIINVSPESFYKGSVYSSKAELQRIAMQMEDDGADILDVGARGTAPYLDTNITFEEETDRMVRAVRAIREVTDIPISVDTISAQVAGPALEFGANILNDVSGLAHDPAMGPIAKRYKGVILMANATYTNPEGDPVTVVNNALKAAMKRAILAGIDPENAVLDPGIGFFRNLNISWYEWDRIILQQLYKFLDLGRPVVISISRKSFIGKVLDHADPKDRLYGSLALTSVSVGNGAHVIRTHDVASTKDVIRMTEWLKSEHINKKNS